MIQDSRDRLIEVPPSDEFVDSSGEPLDRWNFAYILFFIMGMGSLFPWNAFITAAGYFETRFCGTMFESNFENFFTTGYQIVNVIALGLSVKYTNKIPSHVRAKFACLVLVGLFALTSVLVLITSLSPSALFYITMVAVSITGGAGAVFTGGVFGIAASLPPRFTVALMSGQGCAGVIISISSLLTVLAQDDEGDDDTCETYKTDWGDFSYFILSTALLTLCFVFLFILEKLPYVIHYTTEVSLRTPSASRSDATPLLGDEPTSLKLAPVGQKQIKQRERILAVFSKIKMYAFCIWFIFTITISLFPGVSSKIVSTSSNHTFSRVFVPFYFLLFNVADWIGRSLAGWELVKPGWIWILVSLRIVFVPLFLLCKVGGISPETFGDDAWSITFMTLFALSNGYLASRVMMLAPSQFEEIADMELAGTIMPAFLALGLFTGAASSFLWTPITS